MKNYDYDIAIVGAGIAGLTCAIELANNNFSVIILDKTVEPQYPTENQTRVVALTLGSYKIINNVNAWDKNLDERSGIFSDIYLIDANGPGKLKFNSNIAGLNKLGYVIENNLLTYNLYNQAQKNKNIEFLFNATQENIKDIINKSELTIGADGANSIVRHIFDLKTKITPYNHSAIVATIEHEKDHNNIARQVFNHDEILAFLPLKDKNKSSIVWSNNPTQTKNLLSLDDLEFNKVLANNFNYQLGNIISSSKRFSFELNEVRVNNFVTEGAALIGDAAHVIHPLAGQGMNLGILDAHILAKVLIEAKDNKQNIADLNTLKKYQRRRKYHNEIMRRSMRDIKFLFGSENTVISWARNLGLSLINESALIKKRLIKFAAGVNF